MFDRGEFDAGERAKIADIAGIVLDDKLRALNDRVDNTDVWRKLADREITGVIGRVNALAEEVAGIKDAIAATNKPEKEEPPRAGILGGFNFYGYPWPPRDKDKPKEGGRQADWKRKVLEPPDPADTGKIEWDESSSGRPETSTQPPPMNPTERWEISVEIFGDPLPLRFRADYLAYLVQYAMLNGVWSGHYKLEKEKMSLLRCSDPEILTKFGGHWRIQVRRAV